MTASVATAEAGPRADAGRAEAGPGPAAPLLTASGLSVSYGPLRALDDVNLSVRTGELVALAGENGAGKTTLVRCIAGDVVPANGEVFFAGRRVPADQAAAVKQGIAVVWQDLALCDNLDVAANIMLGRERPRLLTTNIIKTANSYVLLAVAAAVIGGTSLFGGRGKTIHGVLGGLVIGGIYNGLYLLGVSSQWIDVVVAAVLLAAAIIDVLSRRGAPRQA
jgi:ABC-type transport system involved in cytochrome bd biosynthesis fused ATPase/permease subunit